MTFRDLEYLLAVAKNEHFGRAAEECHVSQSALSLQLQKLEHELGIQLVERTSRRVVITRGGKEIVERAKKLIQGKQELIDTALLCGGDLPEQVRIGGIPTIAPFLFPTIFKTLHSMYQNTTISFDEEVTPNLLRKISNGDTDIGLLATPIEDSLLDEVPLFEEVFLLAVSSSHPLSKRKSISPKQLVDNELLLLQDTHCLKEQIVGFCDRHRVHTNSRSTASSIATLLSLVKAGAGITMVPEMAIPSSKKVAGLKFIPLTPSPFRSIKLVYRKTSKLGQTLVNSIMPTLVR